MSRDLSELAFFLNNPEMQCIGQAIDRLKRLMPRIWKAPLLGLGAVALFVALNSAQAQTLDEVQTSLLKNFCAELKGNNPGDFFDHAGANLLDLCVPGGGGGTPGGTASSGGGGAAATSTARLAVNRRLAEVRGDEQKEQEKGGGSSADSTFDLGGGLNVFLSGQYESLDRDRTTFEDGYDSDVWGITAGVDYQFTDWIVAGVAFNYRRWDANYQDGGDFDSNSYSPIVYTTVTPFENAFADASLSYTHSSIDRRRNASFVDLGTGVSTSGNARSDHDTDQFSASIVLGYDHPIDRFTIGPRVGFSYARVDIDSYTETGNTGLELAFGSDSVKSMQSSLGAQATAAFSTGFGVVLPQLNADWTHEFENDQRSIDARFAEDGRANPTRFSFQTEKPDRDFFHVGAGVVVVLPNGLQPFANFETLLGNDDFDSYIGTVGLRVEL